ncbi:MAG: hypothetical protein WD063_19245 [Pirellulales bacterium]
MTEVGKLDLLPDEWVEVRSASEILATLEEDGTLDGLPFMPEMLACCGRRYQVYRRADKTCDTVNWTGLRRMERTVHLNALRCDGSGHDGCQAGCLFFWKEAWLKRSPAEKGEVRLADDALCAGNGAEPTTRDRGWLESTVFRSPPADGEVRYRCQATELPKATCPLAWWKPDQYVRDVRMNKIPLAEVLRGLAISAYSKFLRRLTGRAFPNLAGSLKRTPTDALGLRAGEWVIVKSKEEILTTLDAKGRNRGLSFDSEMLPYCGRRFRVLRRVERLIEESTGRMIQPAGVAIILENVVCMSRYRRFCPRSIFPYWREIWLRRAEASETPPTAENGAAAGAQAKLHSP